MRGGGLVVAATIASALARAGAAHADPASDALFEQARALEQRGNYAEACPKFEQVAASDAAAVGALINLGECHEKQHQLVAALAAYKLAELRAEEYGQRAVEDAAGEGIRAVKARIPSVRLDLVTPLPASAGIVVDGKPVDRGDVAPLFVDPGEHTIEIHAPHKRAVVDTFSIDERAEHVVRVELVDGDDPGVEPRVDPGHHRRVLAYELGGAALVVYAGELTAGLVFASQYRSQCPTEDTCVFPNGRSQANSIDTTAKIVTTGLFGLGTLAAGAAVYVFLTAPKLAPIVGADRVGVAYTARF